MPFKLSKLVSDSEFDEIARIERLSYESPPCKLMSLFFPLSGGGSEAREAAIQDAAQRQALWHRSDPSSTWLKVTDEKSGKLVGAALWHIYASDPYVTESEDECEWFAKGEDRDAANALMGQFVLPRMTFMRKPHLCLSRSHIQTRAQR